MCTPSKAQKLDEGELVSFQLLLTANSIQVDTAIQLLIEKEIFTQYEFFSKLKHAQAEDKKNGQRY